MQNRRYTFDDQPIYLLGERACGVRGYNNIQDFYVIRKQCLDSGTLFDDPEFHLSGRCVRPKDICDNPLFLINKTSSFDVERGRLSDCWFLSAVASLSLNEKLFNRVVCDDNSFDNNYAGIFHFRFWQYARWVDVVIDDRLPANGNELVNLHSTQRNEFWLCLLEKAYAKLYGSYEALHAGISCEAFEDFTGGVSEIYNLKGVQNNFYGLIGRAFERHSMITCFKNEAAEGLIRIHAYSIIKVESFQIPNKEEKLQLLQFRNSSEDETEWIKTLNYKPQAWHNLLENEKKLIGTTVDHDNEFWILYQDFIKHFDRLDICILSASSLELDKDSIKWDLSLFEGQWMEEFSAGGCNNNDETFHLNPQYVLTLENSTDSEEHCQVTITLIQKNRRTRESTPPQFLVIGFSIYCVSELQLQQKPFKKEFFETTHCHHAAKFTNSRRVTDNCNLSAGNYVIVPSTFDPNEEGKFVLRVYSDNKHTLKEHDKDVEIKKVNPKIVEAHKVEKLFSDAANSNQEVGWGELKIILDSSMPKDIQQSGNSEGFSRENCRSLVAMMDIDLSRHVKLKEFKKFYSYYKLWKSAFKTFNKDRNNKLNPLEFRDALESIGFSFGAQIIYSLIYQYGNDFNTVSYIDFIMCAVKIQTLIDIFEKKTKEDQARFTLEEWIISTIYP